MEEVQIEGNKHPKQQGILPPQFGPLPSFYSLHFTVEKGKIVQKLCHSLRFLLSFLPLPFCLS